ncbi:MAG: thioesterase family protein [Pseudomonadota bacterium]
MADKLNPPYRADFAVFREITTRWMDNDLYGHVNNATYYSFLDTVVSGYLVDAGFITPGKSDVIGLAVASSCSYFAPVSFPDLVAGGLRVDRIGNSSVTYGVGIFRNHDNRAAALGQFTHVYVDATDRRPVPLPVQLRVALEPLVTAKD